MVRKALLTCLLPVEEKGITLSVNNTDDPAKVSIEIKANRAYYKENLNKQLNLLIYSAGAMRTIATKLDNSILGVDLACKRFQDRDPAGYPGYHKQTGELLNERPGIYSKSRLAEPYP